MDPEDLAAQEAVSERAQTEDLDEKYPNRPINHSPTLPFHELFLTLFNPLNEIKKKPTGPVAARRKTGPHGKSAGLGLNPIERRRDVIERFISRWRQEVGPDIYPAFRLILPDKDRDRAMYGIKEKVIGKMLVKLMKIDRNSEDGFNLLNWKLPGQTGVVGAGGGTAAARMAGDFAGRCYDVLSKRPLRSEVGSMRIDEVNAKLDELAAASREEQQLPVLAEFYRRMNPEELLWLIRIILRQMKVGATERTFFDVWHPDAENLYSISSSLRRVCWELHDPNLRLEAEDRGITLMQCFQPQLAQFQMHSFARMIERMRPTDDDRVFWIEEKLDGERMQLHMEADTAMPGGRRFGFWSRKAKDYTYLYGNGLQDEHGALTRHLADAFADGVENLILDGEMITWDPEQDAPVPFGTLKTAALDQQRNPFASGPRPLFRIFDILYLNDKDLTRYTLRDRRNALSKAIIPVHRRFEIHPYQEATTTDEIETALRTVVAEASEGLVLKNPRSPYRLNERHDDWMKVKPEYMTEFGESLDLIVIGGYYGSGARGGALSSFLCGLRVDDDHHRPSSSSSSYSSFSQGAPDGSKCFSFCKVGGGFTAADYANIRHHTDGKWHEWDAKRPPVAFIELAGGDAQYERPDMWIKPADSVVLCVKAASVSVSDQFRLGLTLRFPRFKRLRMDKDWKSALSVQEFLDLKSNVESEHKTREFAVDNSRKKRIKRPTKKPLSIAGYQAEEVQYAGPSGHVFDGMNFYVMTECLAPEKRSKAELEQLVKANGGKIYQTSTAATNTICVADRRTVKVASVQKSGKDNVLRPSWILDCVKQNEVDVGLPDLLLPLEPRHMFFTLEARKDEIAAAVDQYQDSFARDATMEELNEILNRMESETLPDASSVKRLEMHIQERVQAGYEAPCGWLFQGFTLYFHYGEEEQHQQQIQLPLRLASNVARFAGAAVACSSDDSHITHVVLAADCAAAEISHVRAFWAARPGKTVPHVVLAAWIEDSWQEGTLLDEESVYDPNSDHRRKGVYRKDADTLRTRNTTLQTIIHAILNYEEDDALGLVRQIRACDNLEDVAESILAGEKQLTEQPGEEVGLVSDEDPIEADQFEAELAGKMSEVLLDGSRKFIGGTSNLVFLPPGSELFEQEHALAQQRESSVTHWTEVTRNKQLISHLLTMYFTWHYPFFTTLSKDLFYRDYIRGIPSQYCSSLLVNAMLALGCHFSSWDGARLDPRNSATAGDHFFKEAKRLLLENDEHENARLCTVQALALMSVREAGCGREGKGWVYSGMSFRMALDLGLNLDVPSLGSHTLSEDEIDARRITLWGCFLFDKCWSNYLGRQPQLSTANLNVPKFDILPTEEAELWSPYTDSGVGQQHTQPARIRTVALQVAKLCEISGDLLSFFYHPAPTENTPGRQVELKRLSEIHTRLEAWKKTLPRELEPREGQLPQVLVMHMFFQLLHIHLFRPFLKYTKANSPLPPHVSPRKLCTQAASAISKLLRTYKRTYGFTQICNIVVYIAHTACTIHLLNLPERNAQRDIVHGFKNLEEIGEGWLCARRTLRILDISANKWHVELPKEAVAVLERTHAKWGSWGSWDQSTSPSASADSPTAAALGHLVSASSYSSPERNLQPMQYHDASITTGPSISAAASAAAAAAATMTASYPPSTSPSIPISLTASPMPTARRSLSAQWQRLPVSQPEPTYLRPTTQMAFPSLQMMPPSSQQDAWYEREKEISPASDNFVEQSQGWWSREQATLGLGVEAWGEPSVSAATTPTAYEVPFNTSVFTPGQMSAETATSPAQMNPVEGNTPQSQGTSTPYTIYPGSYR
ncbi:hypothetical protein ASPZODRAFT_148327 [Penicilliopsis zonata CBS 506.65]|uniref:DNA ligase n=1 Tax=Penicilliopsis zonata CBS 506.65 TaxID=1073090 RepID=A0A1L9SUY1_9EURO|nr:hypothetical protein ASPZODRAFT_148327 [Penicilliopsis zonata CBS 506.65]OJJ50946.1 hypothetical protein ASPZODRAFT_148327 [Penicilliopsis zonata CBS 506.65]